MSFQLKGFAVFVFGSDAESESDKTWNFSLALRSTIDLTSVAEARKITAHRAAF